MKSNFSKNLSNILPYLSYYEHVILLKTNKETQRIIKDSEEFNPIINMNSEHFTNNQKVNVKNHIKKIKSIRLKRAFFQFLDNLTDDELVCIKNQKNINSLSINACHKITDQSINKLDDFHFLTKIELYWMPQIKNLSHFLNKNNCANLVEINFSGLTHLDQKSYNCMVSNCSSFNLKILNLTRNLGLNDEIMTNIASKFIHLEYLNLYALSKLDSRFTNSLGSFLTFLDLCGNQTVVDETIMKIKSEKIEYLNLVSQFYLKSWCSNITDKAIEYIANHFKNIKLLSVHGNINITDKSIDYLSKLEKLDTLDVFGCSSIENKSFDFLKSKLKNVKNFKVHF